MSRAAPSSTVRGRGPRVLLVDDDDIQRRLTALQLVDAGYSVETAAGVHEALAKAEATTPAAIVSDVLMGETDGFELCRLVRATPSLASVPVVLASAHFREAGDRALAQRLGASALVTRTPDFHVELAALRDALAAGARGSEAIEIDLRAEHQRCTSRQLSAIAARAISSEARLATFLAHARDAIAIVDPQGVIIEVNRRCEEMFAPVPERLVGRHISEFAPAGHAESNQREYARSQAADAGSVRAVIRRPDGTSVSMEWVNTPIELDGRPAVLCIGRDVSESDRAAEALRQSEERYRSLLERIPYVVWSCDAVGGVDFVSANYEATTGFPPGAPGRWAVLWRDRIHPEDRERVRGALEAFLAGGPAYDVEYRLQHADGRWLRVQDRSSARYVKDGRVRADGVLVDVTRERALETELRHAQKMEAVGQLAGGVAHDFNNLLSVILTNAGLVASDLPPDAASRDELAEIEGAAQRAAALTRQLLAFSRKDVVRTELVEVDAVLRDLGRMLQRMIGEDVDLVVDLGAAGATVEIDRGQLEQIVMNLAINARDAMPEGGTVSIATRTTEIDARGRAGLRPGGYVSLTVKDTGTGIDPALLPRIFEPFFTTKEPGKGTGLGLSTVYGIAHGARGAVAVDGEPGHGAAFEVILPRAPEAPREAPSRERAAVGGSETILLVEDDDAVRAATKRVLSSAGYEVLEARSAAAAIECVRAGGVPDLVVSDVVMPHGSGPAMLAALRREQPDLRAIFVSGHTSHPALDAHRDGALEHLVPKPFAAEILLRKVREVLGGEMR